MPYASNTIKRPHPGKSFRRGLSTVVVLGMLGVGLAAVVLDRWKRIAGPGPSAPGDVLTAAVAGVATILAALLLASCGLAALGTMSGPLGRAARRIHERITPTAMRHLTGILLGATLGTGALPSTGLAGDGPPGPVATASASSNAAPSAFAAGAAAASGAGGPGAFPASSAPDPLFRAERPGIRPLVAPDLLSGTGMPAPAGIVVHRGDCLWDIVARSLGPEASDLEIAEQWPRWYAQNRAIIGDDPDLLLPGQVLQPPPGVGDDASLTAPDPGLAPTVTSR